MPKIKRNLLVHFSAQQMYDLVNDVESYHEFLPGCAGGKVLEFNGFTMKASVDIKKGGIAKSFTTCNKLIPGEKIEINLENGPFKYLKGFWLFTPLTDDACKIDFELDFEFSNTLVALAFGRLFEHMANNMVTAFSQRAKVVYD